MSKNQSTTRKEIFLDLSKEPVEPFDQAAAYREPANPWVPPSQRKAKRAPRLPTNWRSNIEAARRDWHPMLGSAAIEKSWADVEAALDAAQIAADQFFGMATDEANEALELERTIREAAKVGERPQIQRVDWAVERIARETVWDSAYSAALRAGADYSKVVASAAPERVPALIDKADKAREKAKGLHAKSQAAVREYASVLQAIHSADTSLGLTGPGWWISTAANKALAGKALSGLADVSRLLSTDDLWVTGQYLLDTSAALPLSTREAMAAEGGESAFWVLLQIEGSEGWAVTQYTIGSRERYRQLDPELAAQLAAKSFAV